MAKVGLASVAWVLLNEHTVFHPPMHPTRRTLRSLAATLLVAAFPVVACAHPGHGSGGIIAGFEHPFGGWDHLLAMIAVGLWATQLGGRALWLLPAGFVSAMAAGAAAGLAGLALPGAEWGIMTSVLLLGGLVALAVKVPQWAGLFLVMAFALCHGTAHAVELGAGGTSVAFLPGMLAGTALLHAAGVSLGLLAGNLRRPALLRWTGAGIALAGALMFAV